MLPGSVQFAEKCLIVAKMDRTWEDASRGTTTGHTRNSLGLASSGPALGTATARVVQSLHRA